MQETWGERRRVGKLSRSTMEEREAQKYGWLKEKEGVFKGGEIWLLEAIRDEVRP
jgi:hypothetical protein